MVQLKFNSHSKKIIAYKLTLSVISRLVDGIGSWDGNWF